MAAKSKVNRVVLSGEHSVSIGSAPGFHKFVVDAPEGYRVVSADLMPVEDGNWDNVDCKGTALVAVNNAYADRVLFEISYPTSARESVRYDVVCERSDEPDVFTAGTPVDLA